jgi:hypothetical protein
VYLVGIAHHESKRNGSEAMISQTQKFLLSHLRAVIVSTEDCYIRKMVVLLLAVDLTMVVVSPFFFYTV